MAGYTPLFDSLTRGTLAGKWPDIGLWPVVFSLADRNGVVDVIPRFIAIVTGLSEGDVIGCMRRFEESGWLERIYPHLDWGWCITESALVPEIRHRPSRPEWEEIRARIFARDNYTCVYCDQPGRKQLECDHVVPVSRGGSNEDDNLVTACRTCNRAKRDKTPDEWLRSMQ